ncbi:hypothetical protein [Brevundimonas lutea]|uniref:hypothetical protein n=1 Tax=Brevundimonas lutea TaxID=2293980 RepID=UPI000F02A090|nr:hypothetical protein [Brevundimonas lutea]
MIRKTVLLAGVAGALAFAAPAVAQVAPIPQAAPAPAEQTQGAQLALQPGADVAGADGVVYGRLDGAGTAADGSTVLHVRAEDGTVKAVPIEGISMNGATIVTAWAKAQFDAAPTDPALNPPAASGELTLTPGATVVGSGGATLGTLHGAAQGADGSYNILVRAADGQVRPVPAEGLTMNGANIVTAWTQAEFDAAQVDAAATAEASAAAPAEAPTEAPAMDSADPTGTEGMETTPE